MDCSICRTTTMPSMSMGFGLASDRICGVCSKGAKNIIDLVNKLETEKGNAKDSNSSLSRTNSCKTLLDVSKWVVGLKAKEKELFNEISFLHGCVDAYRNRTPSDILLNPGINGSPVAAHRALLVARSKIFKNMMESDTCKTPPLKTITLPELNHEELEALLEFLYNGSLPQEKLEKHVYPLSLAAHKYEIIYLQKFCQNYMLKTLNSCNALGVLEISDFCSFLTVRDNTLSFIVEHQEDIVFSAKYEAFAVRNPHLSVQITRACTMNAKKNRVS